MSKILGLDYGKKRCGVSISDELQIIASPLTTIDTKKLMDFLKEIIVEESISAIVIGLPKNNRNNIFELEKTIIDEIKKIKILFPKLKIHRPIKLIDEFKMSDFELVNYNPDPYIKASMSV